MSARITVGDLVEKSAVARELDKLGQTEVEWWLGPLAVERSSSYKTRASWTWPRWRHPESRRVAASMRLRTQEFRRANGQAAIAVILSVLEEGERYVGWVDHARAAELESWVSLLDDELRMLWSLWDAAGRPTSDVASIPRRPSAAPIPREGNVGRRLANGRFEILEWLGTCPLMGAAIARDHRDGDLVRLTFAADVSLSLDEVRARLTRDLPDVAPVVYVGEAAADDDWAKSSMLMAERMPDGAPAAVLADRGEPHEVAAFGVRLAATLSRIHRDGAVLGTLRPESTFVTSTGEIELVARGERLWLVPRPNMTKPGMMPPWRYGYLAPEHFTRSMVTDPDPAADVFGLGVMLASSLLGQFVYEGEHLSSMLVAQMQGTHRPLPETPLGRLLARCLRADPSERPSLLDLALQLES